ncbi:MAG: histidine phosphatase family protein [Pirellulales bacterium]|nr:histidine phosphatase family protein [Pirellulales bacterium]
MILYCIRHGESTYNAEGRIQGQSDVPLSELGWRQGRAAARAMVGRGVEAVFASPLKRAKYTADMVAEALDLDVQTDERLKEVDCGVFQDRMRQEILREYAGMIEQWRSGRPDFAFPQGESRQSIIRRGHEVLDEISKTPYETVAVVSHGGLLLAGIKSLLGLRPTDQPLSMANTSISKLQFGPDNQVELLEFDRTDHLNDI